MNITFNKKQSQIPQTEIRFGEKTQKFIESPGINNYLIQQKLTGEMSNSWFGHNVSLNKDANVLIMGGPFFGPSDVGAAFIYTGSSNTRWNLKQKLFGNNFGDYFGWSTSINKNGTILLIGAPNPDIMPNSGISFIYTGNSTNGWVLKQTLTGEAAGNQFGISTCINNDGSVLVIGQERDDPNGISNAGSALVYTGNAVAGWRLKQKLIGDSTNDWFGRSVAINANGTVLMMGGINDDPNSIIDAGGVFVYTGDAINGWVFKQHLIGNSSTDQFGRSVAINANGTVLMMGGINDDSIGFSNDGAAFVYTGNSTNGWVFKQRLTDIIPFNASSDNFGWSVATNDDGTILIMGGDGDDSNGNINVGASLVFTGNAINGWILHQRLTGDSSISSNDSYGRSVATNSDGTIVVMGGWGDDDAGSDAGAALIYTSKVLVPTPQTQTLFK